MANIFVSIEKGIEIAAADALRWLTGAGKGISAAPAVLAALATVVGATEQALSDVARAAQDPLNVSLDVQTVKDLEAVWPAVKAFLKTLGISL
jgi:hypothetical protein